jgi:hypothetical protein
MIDNIKLKQELDSNNINYTQMNNGYVVDVAGSSFIIEAEPMPEKYGSKDESILSIFWTEKEPSQRTIDLSIVIDTEETYDTAMQLLFALIELANEGEIYLKNEDLRDKISGVINHLNLIVTKLYIDGLNPNIQDIDLDDDIDAGQIGYYEKPMNKIELQQAMDKAVEDNDKESYYKYQQMLNALKESVSFTYLKKFKDFL